MTAELNDTAGSQKIVEHGMSSTNPFSDGTTMRPMPLDTGKLPQLTLNALTSAEELRRKQILELDLSHLSNLEQAKVRDLLYRYVEVVSDGRMLGHTTVLQHTIDTGSACPVVKLTYRCTPEQNEMVEAEVKKNLEMRAIEP